MQWMQIYFFLICVGTLSLLVIRVFCDISATMRVARTNVFVNASRAKNRLGSWRDTTIQTQKTDLLSVYVVSGLVHGRSHVWLPAQQIRGFEMSKLCKNTYLL